MALIRTLLARRHLAMLIVLAALAVRMAVPGGYMLSAERGQITIGICADASGQTMTLVLPLAPTAGDARDGAHEAAKMPCAFAGLAHQALGAADPVLITSAIAYIMARATFPAPQPVARRSDHLRPPLRGPPVTF